MASGRPFDSERKQRIVDAYLKQRVPVSTLSQAYGVRSSTIWMWIKAAKQAAALQIDNINDNEAHNNQGSISK